MAGEEIPLAARIFTVVVVWDSPRSEWIYREAWEDERLLDYIQEQAGKAFDPQGVEVFFKAVGEGSGKPVSVRT